MTFAQMCNLILWDLRVNRGFSLDSLRARLLVIELRLEQYVYRKTHPSSGPAKALLWSLARGWGSMFQWFVGNVNIPGSVDIGRGLRLPHPNNIVIAAYAEIGEFCTIYHNVSVAWNGFEPVAPLSPKIGDRVLVGCGAIIIGNISVGSEVLVGAGAIVSRPVPDYARVTAVAPTVTPRHPSHSGAEPGSERHLKDPYSIWR
jgi:serine O-acetyltransferase